MPTPPPNVTEENIENFERRWKHVLDLPEYEKTKTEINKIKIHVRKGCLSDINPGEGTSINENLHHFINRCLLCGSSTIGPELATAVLTILFYTINSKRKRYHHDKNTRTHVSIPIESVLQCGKEPAVSSKSNLDKTNSDQDILVNQETETESQTKPVESPLLLVGDSVDDFCQVDVAETILKHSNEMLNVLERINTANQNRSFNVFDTPLLQLKGLNNIIYTETIDQQLVDDIVKQNTECKCKGCQNKEKITTVQSTSNVISCSCGKGKKKSDPLYKSCTDGVRKSKCRCLKNGWKCTSACECYNCHNQTKELPVPTQNDETKSGKRKRVNPSPYKRAKSKEYLKKEMGHEPLQGSWTHFETFVLVSILSLLSTLPLSPSINDIAKLYNFIADYDKKWQKNEHRAKIRAKSTAQMSGKVSNIQDIQEINESLQQTE
ncbi:Hypothetical predicted protein [Paramuricea clavata]|uniref:Uncharacterized protein n=1 Tax=Paramuricea clavata TaxID=317549 RepID=A0A6S7H0Z2_PARCT|nr:Hypothetical predicted protein [Paramuricea clavata]